MSQKHVLAPWQATCIHLCRRQQLVYKKLLTGVILSELSRYELQPKPATPSVTVD